MILPMQDEETGAEPRVLSASICDPYLLLIRDDSSAFLAQMNSDDELEEMDKADSPLTSTKWLSGCLYADTTGIFSKADADNATPRTVMFLLSSAGALQVSRVLLLKPEIVGLLFLGLCTARFDQACVYCRRLVPHSTDTDA